MEKKSFFDYLNSLKPFNKDLMLEAKGRMDSLIKPTGSLGFIEDIAIRSCGITNSLTLDFTKKANVIFASDNGIYEEGYNRYPQELTERLAKLNREGTAGGAIIAQAVHADTFVCDIGLASTIGATGNITKGPAMTEEEMMNLIDTGIRKAEELKNSGYQLLSAGEIGLGNTSTSAAIISVLTNTPVEETAGTGSGTVGNAFDSKVRSIRIAIDTNQPNEEDPLDVLQKVGGRDIASMVGFYAGCAVNGVPVIVDGFVACTAALILSKLNPNYLGYLFFSHLSAEKGTPVIFEALGLKPYLDLGFRLGEGTGALMLMPFFDAAANVINNMAVL